MEKIYFDRIQAHPGIDNSILEYLSSPRKRFIYGSGEQAANCIGLFREMNILVDGLLIPAGLEAPLLKGYWGRMIDSVKRISTSDLTKQDIEDSVILVATPRTAYREAAAYLDTCGFQHIFTCAWGRNQYLRDICMDIYAAL